MWLFTKYGFFSVVNARKGRGHVTEPLDPDTLQVRARSRAHLENIIARFDALHGSEIIETPRADYLFRILVPRDVWGDIAGDLVGEITYDDFKGECGRRHESLVESPSDDYIDALHKAWHTMNEFQGRVHGRGAYVRPGGGPR